MTTETKNTPTSDSAESNKTIHPPRYHVIMHNDDYTTMEFVIALLQKVFRKSSQEAAQLMLTIHTEGQATCGCYPHEIAETKITLAHYHAKEAGYPLRCSLDEA